MWSAIPVALLCMIVSVSEREQGSGPEEVKVLQNTGGLLFICLSKSLDGLFEAIIMNGEGGGDDELR